MRKPRLCGDNREARRLAAELSPCQVPGDDWSELPTQLHHVLSRHALALQQQTGATAGEHLFLVQNVDADTENGNISTKPVLIIESKSTRDVAERPQKPRGLIRGYKL